MRSLKWPGLAAGLILLPTMVPVWVVAIAGAMILLRRPTK